MDEGRIESTADTELYKLTLPTEVTAAPQVSALTLQAAAHMHTHQATALAKQGVQHKKQCAYSRHVWDASVTSIICVCMMYVPLMRVQAELQAVMFQPNRMW